MVSTPSTEPAEPLTAELEPERSVNNYQEWLTPGLVVSTVLSLVALLAVITFGLVAIQLNTSAELRSDIKDLRTDLRSDIGDFRTEIIARMDKQDTRMDRQDTRMDRQGARMDKQDLRLDQLSARLDQQSERIDDLRVELGGRMDQIYQLLLPTQP